MLRLRVNGKFRHDFKYNSFNKIRVSTQEHFCQACVTEGGFGKGMRTKLIFD